MNIHILIRFILKRKNTVILFYFSALFLCMDGLAAGHPGLLNQPIYGLQVGSTQNQSHFSTQSCPRTAIFRCMFLLQGLLLHFCYWLETVCQHTLYIQLGSSTAEANGNSVTHTFQCEWKRSAPAMFVCIYEIIHIFSGDYRCKYALVSSLDVYDVLNQTDL